MTALFLNLLQTSRPIEMAGIPLDGLPALEAGRTLPKAFADALGKATLPIADAPSDDQASAAGALRGEAKLATGLSPDPDETPGPRPAIPAALADKAAASGSTLPHARPEFAAARHAPRDVAPAQPAPIPENAPVATVDAPKAATAASIAPEAEQAQPRASDGEVVAAARPAVRAPQADAAPDPETGSPVPTAQVPERAKTMTPAGKAAPDTQSHTATPAAAPQLTKVQSGGRPTGESELIGSEAEPDGAPQPAARARPPGETPVVDTATQAPAAKSVADEALQLPGDADLTPEAQPDDAAQGAIPATPAQPDAPSPVAQPLVVPVGVSAGTAVEVAAADVPARQGSSPRSAPAANGIAPATPASIMRAEGASAQSGQDLTGEGSDSGSARPDAQADRGAKSPAPVSAAAQPGAPRVAEAASPSFARPSAEAPQTGLSLQVRAADKPIAAVETSQLASLSSSATGTGAASGANVLAAPLAAAPTVAAPLGFSQHAGAMPNSTDLAAFVDRIAAARDSAGSASATIAVAHKELGNLSLTFETSGRMLDVEVAAQDSDTQRVLAAAIADRPHLRGAEAQAGTQNQPGQSQTGQPNTAAQGGDANARHSGEAGDARSGRQGEAREDGRRGNRSGPDGNGPSPRSPKSDGGIYA